MIGRHPLLARGKWLPVLCAGAALSVFGVARGETAHGRDSITVTTRGSQPTSALSPSGNPATWTFNLIALAFALGADISAKGVFGEWRVYADVGSGQFLFYQGGQFVLALPAGNFVALGVAPTGDGLFFVGVDRGTGQAQGKDVYIGRTAAPSITDVPLPYDSSQGIWVKGDSLGNIGVGFVAGGLALHWNSMPPDQFDYHVTSSMPVDGVFEPSRFDVLTRNSNGITLFPSDGSAPTSQPFAYPPTSLAYGGPNNHLYVGHSDQPFISEIDPATFQEVRKIPARSKFGLNFLAAGNPDSPPILQAVGTPRTMTFYLLESNEVMETDVTLSRGTVIDYEDIQGDPFSFLLDVIDPNTGKGVVFLMEVDGRDPDPDAVSHRLEDDEILITPQ